MGEMYKLVRVEDKRSFLKRHNSWITFSGTLILLLTFIVKEELREHWKQKAEAVDTALSIYSIRKGLGDQSIAIDSAVSNIAENHVLLLKQVGTVRCCSWDRIFADLNDEKKKVEYDIADLERLTILVEQLPKQQADQKYLEELKQNDFKIIKEMDEIHTAINNANFPQKEEDFSSADNEKREDIQGRIEGIGKGVDELREDSREVAERAIKFTETFHTSTARKALWAEWISVALYCLGACVGLLGKLNGGAETSAE